MTPAPSTCSPRRSSSGSSGEGAEVLDAVPGQRELVGAAYEPPFPFIPRRPSTASKGHTRPARRLRHRRRRHRPGAHGHRLRRGRLPSRLASTTSPWSTPCASTAPTTSASGPTPGAGSRRPTPTSSRPRAPRRLAARRGDYEHAYPHCWRCATPLIYYAKPSWYIRTTRACATGCWPPTRRSPGTPSTSSTGASATGWSTTSTGRSRASATGARRCRCGAAPARHVAVHRLASPSWQERSRRRGARRPHRPFVDDVELRLPECGEPMRRVPEVIDVWFDSGAMPFAQWHAPHSRARSTSARASPPTSSARRWTRRAAGSTRCWPSPRCSTTARPTRTSSASG